MNNVASAWAQPLYMLTRPSCGKVTIVNVLLQACSHLPETGVADEATWKSLLGADARPEDIALLLSGGEDDVDMTEEMQDRGVWLVGEQRFSKRQM